MEPEINAPLPALPPPPPPRTENCITVAQDGTATVAVAPAGAPAETVLVKETTHDVVDEVEVEELEVLEESVEVGAGVVDGLDVVLEGLVIEGGVMGKVPGASPQLPGTNSLLAIWSVRETITCPLGLVMVNPLP